MADTLTSNPAYSSFHLQDESRTIFLAHKTELVSELMKAAANQFNNSMMAITSYAELEMKTASSSHRRNLEQVLSNASQAAALVQKLLAISCQRSASPQSTDLNQTLDGIRSLLEQLLDKHISVEYKLNDSIPSIYADPVEIEQAVLSLAINARNAMPNGGTLTINTELVDENKEALNPNERLATNSYVLLGIADTGGSSIATESEDEAHRHEQDARMRLSLAAVRGIIKNAGGSVQFNTDPAKSNQFKIYFPGLKQDTREDSKGSRFRNVAIARTILVVEDDDAVRLPTAEFLKTEGFKVLQAKTGDEAIHLMQQNRSHLDVLITDIVMPGISGIEMAEMLLQFDSDLKVLYMSGDAGDTEQSRATAPYRNAVLRKPFRLEALTARIHELLGE